MPERLLVHLQKVLNLWYPPLCCSLQPGPGSISAFDEVPVWFQHVAALVTAMLGAWASCVVYVKWLISFSSGSTSGPVRLWSREPRWDCLAHPAALASHQGRQYGFGDVLGKSLLKHIFTESQLFRLSLYIYSSHRAAKVPPILMWFWHYWGFKDHYF